MAGPGGWPDTGKLPSGNPGGTCMANRPVNTGSGGAAAPPPPDAAPPFGSAPQYDTAPPYDTTPPFHAAPPPVHHEAFSGPVPVAPAASRNRVGHRAPRAPGTDRAARH